MGLVLFEQPLVAKLIADSKKNGHSAFLLSARNFEWSYGESNPGPLDCQSSALPAELQPHI